MVKDGKERVLDDDMFNDVHVYKTMGVVPDKQHLLLENQSSQRVQQALPSFPSSTRFRRLF